jgi:5,10-methenyltetrahydromethanopterin hydrogenase
MNTDMELESDAERATSYADLIISLFKNMDVDPAEALTATLVTSAIISRGIGVPRKTIDKVIKDVFDGVYNIEAPTV